MNAGFLVMYATQHDLRHSVAPNNEAALPLNRSRQAIAIMLLNVTAQNWYYSVPSAVVCSFDKRF
jgi:hypothetical protein